MLDESQQWCTAKGTDWRAFGAGKNQEEKMMRLHNYRSIPALALCLALASVGSAQNPPATQPLDAQKPADQPPTALAPPAPPAPSALPTPAITGPLPGLPPALCRPRT